MITIAEEFRIRDLAVDMVFAHGANIQDIIFHKAKRIDFQDLPETIAFKAYLDTLEEK